MSKHLVYAGYGPVEFLEKKSKLVGGVTTDFMVYKTLSTNMTILIPEKELSRKCRELVSKQEAKEIQDYLSDGESPKVSTQTWNRRYRQAQDSINDGNLREVAKVLKELTYLANSKELSFGERKMMDKAQDLINIEIDLVMTAS